MFISFSDWELVGKNMECAGGNQESKGVHSNIADCAEECRGLTGMFTFETNCIPSNECMCYCETGTKVGEPCTTKSVTGYDLYMYKGKQCSYITNNTYTFLCGFLKCNCEN